MNTKIVRKDGVNHICINGEKLIDPLAFKSFRPTEGNVGDFYREGVRIFHPYVSGLPSGLKMDYSLYGETWFGDGDYRFENFDKQMEFFLSSAPDAYFFVNLHVDSRPWWLEENPGNVDSFTHLGQIAGNEKWRKDTCDYIRAFIEYAEEKYGDKILGYWLLGGHTTEWFTCDREEEHPVKLAAYRKFVGDPSARIPTLEELTKPAEQMFLDPVQDAEVIRYRKFHAKLISSLVLEFCHAAKEATGRRKLVGLFFGYIMELRKTLWYYSHLDLDVVNESPDVDMIATPSSYHHRLYDDGSAHMILTDSLDLHEKCYFSSFDNLTFLAPGSADDPRRLCQEPLTVEALRLLTTKFGRNDLLNTREKTIHGMRREMMSRLGKRCGTWWFDMLEGWYYDDGLMAEVHHLADVSKRIHALPRQSNSEICVFVGSEPLYYVNPECGVHTDAVVDQRGNLSRMGAPYDLYSVSDLERVDQSRYKFFVFLHLYSLTDRQRDYINQTLKKEGRSLLFVGPCDYIGETGVDLARSEALVEMKLSLLEKDEESVRAFDSTYGYKTPKNPTPAVEEEGVCVLGRFADCRKAALACREGEDYRIFFSAVGGLSHQALREMARMAGVHIFAENGVFTYGNDTVLGIYNTGSENTKVHLKKDGEYEELFSGVRYQSQDKIVTLPTGKSPAQMLLLKP